MKFYKELYWTNEMVSRFWDWQSQYPELYFTNLFGAEIAQSVSRYIGSRKRVLDFGCGVGYLISHLAKHADEVYGADLSEESVKACNDRNRDVKNFRGARLSSQLVEDDRQFDAITCIEVIEHLYDQPLESVVNCIHSLLADDGVAIFTTPNAEDLSLNMIMCPTSGELFHRWQHVRSWNAHSLSDYLESSGFEVVQVIETNLVDRFSLRPGYIINKILRSLTQSGGQKAPHLICIAKKKKS